VAGSLPGPASGDAAGSSPERRDHLSAQHLLDHIWEAAFSLVAPQQKKEIDKLSQVQRRATKAVRSWNTCPVGRGWGRWAGPA